MDKYFSGTTISTSSNFLLAPSAVDYPKRLDLCLKDDKSFVVNYQDFQHILLISLELPQTSRRIYIITKIWFNDFYYKFNF